MSRRIGHFFIPLCSLRRAIPLFSMCKLPVCGSHLRNEKRILSIVSWVTQICHKTVTLDYCLNVGCRLKTVCPCSTHLVQVGFIKGKMLLCREVLVNLIHLKTWLYILALACAVWHWQNFWQDEVNARYLCKVLRKWRFRASFIN